MKQKFIRSISILLCVVLLCGILPFSAFADEEDTTVDYSAVITDPEKEKTLLTDKLTALIGGSAKLEAFRTKSEANANMLDWFFADTDIMRLYFGGGAPEGNKYENSFQILSDLYALYSADLEDETPTSVEGVTMGNLYLRMMITLSLTHSNGLNTWINNKTADSTPANRYQVYKNLRLNDYLYKSGDTVVFDTLCVEEMRWVLNNMIRDYEITWLNMMCRGWCESNPGKWPFSGYNFIRYTFGYNYALEKYYSSENYDTWNEKYHLEEYGIPYGDTSKPMLWMVFEEGAVCGGISKTGSNMCASLGVPSGVIGQPGHAAYVVYIYGENETSYWTLYNDVSGWAKSEKGERMLLNWGKAKSTGVSYYQIPYIHTAQLAMNDFDNYIAAQEIMIQYDSATSDEERIAICETALQYLPYDYNAWFALITLAIAETRPDIQKLYDYTLRICQALPSSPLFVYDFVNRMLPSITKIAESKTATEEEKYYAAMAQMELSNTLTAAKTYPGSTANITCCRVVAASLLGNVDYDLATFSFDGDYAGKLVFNESFSAVNFYYSIDGRETVSEVVATETYGERACYTLTAQEIASINPDDDISILLCGLSDTDENWFTIDITTGSAVSNPGKNDYEGAFVNAKSGYDYSIDGGATWQKLAADKTFNVGDSVLLRKSATGSAVAGTASSAYVFAEPGTPSTASRSYISISRYSLKSYSSEQANQGHSAAHAVDGIFETMWHTNWTSNSDLERYVTVEFTEPLLLSGIDYYPRSDSSANGVIMQYEVLVSLDNENWYVAGTGTWANNRVMKTATFSPVYCKYARLHAITGVGNFASAREIVFFEDTRFTPENLYSFEVVTDGAKTSYLKGESFCGDGISVIVTNKDGNTATVPNWQLEFDTNPTTSENNTELTTVGENTVYIKCGDWFTTYFTVNVEENELVPDEIEIYKLPDTTEFIMNEPLDLTGLVIKAIKDDTVWYINANELSNYCMVTPANGEILNIATDDTIVTITWNDTSLAVEFNVNVSHAPIIILENPVDEIIYGDSTFSTLSVSAHTNGGTLVYNWYKSATVSADLESDTLIEGATESTYTPTESGYYYAAIRSSDGHGNVSEPVCTPVTRCLKVTGALVNETTLQQYTDIESAVADSATGDTIVLFGDVSFGSCIDLADRHLTFRSEKLDDSVYTISRSTGYEGTFLTVGTGNLTLEDIIIDGGAVWTGDADSTLARGTVNSGLTATAPLIKLTGTGTINFGDGCVIQNCYYNGEGTVIYTSAAGTVNFLDGSIVRNTQSYDGSIFIANGSKTVLNIKGGEFYGNNGTRYAGVVMFYGNTFGYVTGGNFHNNKSTTWGGVLFTMSSSTVLNIANATFTNNYSANGGVIFFGGPSTNTIDNCTFVNNSAVNGGVLCIYANGKHTFTDCEFSGNTATAKGGAIFDYEQNNFSPTLTLVNSIFTDNTAGTNGGAVSLNKGTLNASGGYVSGNTAPMGEAVYCNGNVNLTDTNSDDNFWLVTGRTLTFTTTTKDKHIVIAADIAGSNRDCRLTSTDAGKIVCSGTVSGSNTADTPLLSLKLDRCDEFGIVLSTDNVILPESYEESITFEGDCKLAPVWMGGWLNIHKDCGYTQETVNPTCSEQGYILYTCEAHSSTYKDSFTDKISHDFSGEYITNNDGTHSRYCIYGCGETGNTESCNFGEVNVVREAKCSENGLNSYTCIDCGYVKTEETFKEHSKVYHDAKPATCTEDGWNAYETCNNCGYTTLEIIKAKGHTEVTIPATAPTCTQNGRTAGTKCSVCETVIKTGDVIPATNHNFSGGIKSNGDGTHSYSCVNGCGSYGNQTNCNYGEGVVTEATCITDGTVKYTCNDCGYVREDKTSDKTGHSYVDGECTTCGDKCSCNCHKTGFMGAIWKIVRFFQKLFKKNQTCACGVNHW